MGHGPKECEVCGKVNPGYGLPPTCGCVHCRYCEGEGWGCVECGEVHSECSCPTEDARPEPCSVCHGAGLVLPTDGDANATGNA